MLVSVAIFQAAATSFIHMQMFAVSQAIQSMRYTATRSGASGERSDTNH
ncbi:hypothetical protein [Aquabacterium sp.]